MSVLVVAIHGDNHPQLNAAMKSQIDAMSHVMFGGITDTPAIELCRKLVAMPPNRWSAFCGLRFRSGGSGDENGVAVLASQAKRASVF